GAVRRYFAFIILCTEIALLTLMLIPTTTKIRTSRSPVPVTDRRGSFGGLTAPRRAVAGRDVHHRDDDGGVRPQQGDSPGDPRHRRHHLAFLRRRRARDPVHGGCPFAGRVPPAAPRASPVRRRPPAHALPWCRRVACASRLPRATTATR